VVLAAGFSSRAGCFKMTCMLAGRTMIERCIDGLYGLCGRVIVVGGYRIGELAFLRRKYARLDLIFNEDYKSGMFGSVRCGLRASAAERVFVAPGDYPLIQPNVYRAMLDTRGEIVLPSYRGRTGHPVLLARPAVDKILAGAYPSLCAFINEEGYRTVEVEEPGILIDLDTPEDYGKIVSQMARGVSWSV
jgi:molybdenum cofactor cytidylyltransferase